VRHQILFSGYHISPETLPLYINELRRQQPPWICGYPSLLTLIASYIVDSKTDLGYSPRCVTTLSENLLAQQRSTIVAAFGVAPRQHYGMTEGAVNMGECELGRMHVDEDFSAVEFVPDEGGLGTRVVGTAFHNPATAFLRYEVGDRASPSKEKSCPCGRPGRLVEAIDGRREDYVILRDGSMVGRMDHVFKDLVNVREAQIYQKIPGEITVRIVRGSAYGLSDEERLRLELQKRLGTETQTHIEYSDALLRGKNGKLRFVVSDLNRGKIAPSDDAPSAEDIQSYSR
jgi:phenylacetate-CoA ligase